MKYILILLLSLCMYWGTVHGQNKDIIENKVFRSDFDVVWNTLVELLIRHQWQFNMLDKPSGFIETKAYPFKHNRSVQPVYIRAFLIEIAKKRTKVHISFQLEKEYKNALDTDLKIGKLSIAQKIHSYFVQLDSALEQSRDLSLERKTDRKEILYVLGNYVEAEESHDVEGQLRWFRFPYTFGRENRPFETVNERDFRKILKEKSKQYHKRYGNREGTISLFNRSVEFFGKTFAVVSFDWDYTLPDGEIHYGQGSTFFVKQDSTWKIAIQYDVDK